VTTSNGSSITSSLKLLWRCTKNFRWSFFNLYLCLFMELVLETLSPIFIGLIVDEAVYYQNMEFFLRILLLYVVTMAFTCLLYFIHPRIWAYLSVRYVFQLRLQVFDKILFGRASSLASARSGDIITRLNKDADEFMHLVQRNIFHFTNGCIRIVLYGAIVWVYSWKAALLISFVIPVSVWISKYYGGKVRRQSVEARKAYGFYTSWLFEVLKGLTDIRLLSAEKKIRNQFISHYKEIIRIKNQTSVIQLFSNLIVEFVKLTSELSMYILAGFLAYSGEITLGIFIVLVEYFRKTNSLISYLISNNMDMQSRKGSVDRINEILHESSELEDSRIEQLIIRDGQIEFSQVSFAYQDDRNILNNLCLRIEGGEHLALVGSSGAGKSTLAYLLLQFHTKYSGTITVDGQDLRKCSLKSIRKKVGMVQQETLVIEGTFRMNLVLSKRSATDEEILEACRLAALQELIDQLPQGLDTILGKGGYELSGGQKQRLAIARIYLRDPIILIFDEATSALDFESEESVHQAWEKFCAGRTTITIAHRLSTIVKSDRVAFLNGGRILMTGSHQSLLDNCPSYRTVIQVEVSGQEAAVCLS
jgi:ATP-binding cassette, subfamily B, bacterial